MGRIIENLGMKVNKISKEVNVKNIKRLVVIGGAAYIGYKYGVKKTNSDRDIELTIILNKYPDLLERFEEAANNIKFIKRG